jgi:phosphopentomutase
MSLTNNLNKKISDFLKHHPIYNNSISNLQFKFEVNLQKPTIEDNKLFESEIFTELKKHISSIISNVIFSNDVIEITNITNIELFFQKTNEKFFIINPNLFNMFEKIENFTLYPNIEYSNYSIYKIGKINDIYIFEDIFAIENHMASINPSINILINNLKEDDDRLIFTLETHYDILNRKIYHF